MAKLALYSYFIPKVSTGEGKVTWTDLIYFLVRHTPCSSLKQDLSHFILPSVFGILLQSDVLCDGLIAGRLSLEYLGLLDVALAWAGLAVTSSAILKNEEVHQVNSPISIDKVPGNERS